MPWLTPRSTSRASISGGCSTTLTYTAQCLPTTCVSDQQFSLRTLLTNTMAVCTRPRLAQALGPQLGLHLWKELPQALPGAGVLPHSQLAHAGRRRELLLLLKGAGRFYRRILQGSCLMSTA
eukprot:925739-Pelagomonas_calceolata.AAC.2